ncbi:AAA family ATPase [Bradyrhizobium sp. JYMT SZCCT0428]|uniref:AAA family ATPase n=1 Tax=Bradyrhizobium sp. JYMT SZCCT0428 TaxID=2807673 RepID=UPI001BA54574|nr:AAA family ATPase [Bradyrhizobium sp. JYMT SZCCT0428]MBR1157200.1 AAA family ATPase [Bradyrhizobium sp. JYMT SZCCT0428]
MDHRDGTVEELTRIVNEEPCVIAEERRGAVRALPFRFYDDADIPWPDYIYGTSYIRGILSITASAGGLGKSALVLTEALAMSTGKPLIHGIASRRPQTVWYINLEDGDNVLVPRLMAAARSYEITDEEIGDRLILDNSDMKLVLASEDERRGASLNQVAVAEMIRTIKAKQIDVVIIDPLVSAHRIPENDNNGMDVVAKALARIARETNCALMVVHHMTKGKDERTSDNVRGASALANAARVVRVLNPMAKGGEAGVTEEKAGSCFSVDDGKTNLAPAEKRMWFQRVNYDGFSFDDWRKNVVVVKSLAAANPASANRLANLTETDVRAAFREGGPWRERGTSDRWAGFALAASLGVGAESRPEKAALQQAIGRAVRRGWLVRYDAPDEHRHTRSHVHLASVGTSDAPIEGDAT